MPVMRSMENPLEQDKIHPLLSLLSLFGIVLGGMIIFGLLLSMVFLLPLGIESMESVLSNINEDITPKMKMAVLIFQGSASVGGFILAPIIFLFLVAKIKPATLFQQGNSDLRAVFFIFLMVISFMVVDAPIIEWNSNIEFPSFLKEYEQMALDKEEELAKITEIITTFDSTGQLLLGMLVIAIIPAIGEEFLFRGLIQNYVAKLSGNHHAAIWLTAAVFGAFHMQFYGLIPRILLGALFGYLYVWSGSLWMAIWAHFVNNGFTLIMSYLYQKGGVDYDIQEVTLPPVSLILLAVVFFVGLVYLFRKQYYIRI